MRASAPNTPSARLQQSEKLLAADRHIAGLQALVRRQAWRELLKVRFAAVL
jgi:hypothetical protein